ncbi:site-specific integrase [Persicobacter psychrovividus]
MIKYRVQRFLKECEKRWYVEYWITTEVKSPRKRIYISHKKFPTLKEKERQVKKVIQDLESGEIIEKPKRKRLRNKKDELVRLSTAISDSLNIIEREVAKNTHAAYKKSLKKLEYYFDDPDCYLHDVSASDIINFLDYLTVEERISNSTRNSYLKWLKAMFERFKARGWISTNPCIGIKGFREDIQMHKAFCNENAQMILSYLKGEDLQLFVFVMLVYQCFLRPSEIYKLQVKDILFDLKKIIISKNVAKTKVAKYPRFNDSLKAALQKYLEGAKNDDFIISQRRTFGATQTTNYSIGDRHRKVLKRFGLDHANHTLYGWKHTGNIELYRLTKDIKFIQAQNGHSSVNMTDRYLRDLGVIMDDEISLVPLPDFKF